MRSLALSSLPLRRLGSLVGALALVALFSSSALAKESAAPAAAPISCGSVKQLVVVTNSVAQVNAGGLAFANLPGAVANINVPAGANACLLARFTSESACYGGTGYCNVRILIDGVEAAPVAGTDFSFDSTDAGAETSSSWESHAVERIRVVGPGAHVVQVQWAVTQAATKLRLDDYTLVVERT